MKGSALSLVLICALAVMGAWGCSGDSNNANENNTNNTNNTNADMGANNAQEDMNTSSNNSPSQWESNYQLIFRDMIFNQGSPGSGTLNNVLRKSFRMDQEYPTIILVDIKDVDAEAGTTKVKGGAGEITAVDGEYKWDAETPDVYYDGTLNKDTGVVTGTFADFKFIATIPTEGEPLRVILPIQDLSFSAKLTTAASGGGVVIEGGEMTGYLTKAQGDTIEIFINGMTLTLTSLLKESTLNLDTDGDDVNDAWKLEATFKAESAKIVN